MTDEPDDTKPSREPAMSAPARTGGLLGGLGSKVRGHLLSLPVGETRRVQDYRILVSFELTPDDLALNRRRGPR